MARPNFNELQLFVTVARMRSFTKAAAHLGLTQSALSHTVRTLEERLGIRLLTRTTRSVAPTDAGERLMATVGAHLDDIEAELQSISELRDKPAGTVRITTGDHALSSVLWPKLLPVLRKYPDIHIEFDVSYGLRDIVADRFDAGVRLGEQVEKDMVAVPIGPDMRMAAVASPTYLATHPTPRHPRNLAEHRCINLRLPTFGGSYPWEFERDGREVHARVDGQLTFSTAPHVAVAAVEGFGIACLPEGLVMDELKAGKLVRLLEDWSPPFPGYHLYYPSRRQHSSAFTLVVEALRYTKPARKR
jgi:DNA-binding transcriptional LysR family regulator